MRHLREAGAILGVIGAMHAPVLHSLFTAAAHEAPPPFTLTQRFRIEHFSDGQKQVIHIEERDTRIEVTDSDIDGFVRLSWSRPNLELGERDSLGLVSITELAGERVLAKRVLNMAYSRGNEMSIDVEPGTYMLLIDPFKHSRRFGRETVVLGDNFVFNRHASPTPSDEQTDYA